MVRRYVVALRYRVALLRYVDYQSITIALVEFVGDVVFTSSGLKNQAENDY